MGSCSTVERSLTRQAAEAISDIGLLLKLDSSGYWAVNTVGNAHDGIATNGCASGGQCTGLLRGKHGTVEVVAAGAVTLGDTLYAAASGKVSTTVSGPPLFKAMQAASGDGSHIEALPLSAATAGFLPSTLTVEAHTAGDTLLAAESGTCHTNTGASGAITIVLPAATVGQMFVFVVGAAQELRIDPNGTENICLPSSGVPGANGKYLVADALYESVILFCAVAGKWSVLGYTGTWTAEA